MFRYATTFLIVLLFKLASPTAIASTNSELQHLKNAVVKIYTTSVSPDYFTPWRLLNAKQSSGSGAVIAGNRILTNAHVVADARYIQVQRHNDPKKFLAHVSFVSHEADLAMLEVEDTSFFRGLKSLSIGKLPEPLQEVSVYGYPFGGNSLSITRGILSRVEHQFYSHSERYLLAGQIDAAINPGNSGGPVIVNKQIVGVVMQANFGSKSENQGYFVPPSVVQHFLKDAEDGIHHGIPDLGFRTQEMESPAMKKAFGTDTYDGGVLITKVFDNTAAAGKIFPNDVLLAIDGYDIADDTTIKVRDDLRTNYKYAIDQYHVGDKITLKISRNGKIKDISLIAVERAQTYSLVREEEFDELPEYFIYGGVVFVPLNMNLIKRWGRDWRNKAPTSFLHAQGQFITSEKTELVVAVKVLAADVNLGYHNWNNFIVDSVNGIPIRDFAQFVTTVRNLATPYTVFEDSAGYKLVLDNLEARASEAQILSMYQIPSAVSANWLQE
ncbi:S1C family serine protease [Aurantivibrio plasticivorans]